MPEIKLPRGRMPQGGPKLTQYIKKVAHENGVTYDAAEKVVTAKLGGHVLAPNGNGIIKQVLPADSTPQETDKQILDRISYRFSALYKQVHSVCKGNIPSLIISGAGGVGKTHAVTKIVDDYKEKGSKVNIISGVVSPIHLYMQMYFHREAGEILVLDDADDVWFDESALSIMKAALDSSLIRKVAWMAKSPTLKEAGVENQFEYRGNMIFISNLDFRGIAEEGKLKIAPHLAALLTRSMYLDLKLHSEREVMLWIKHVIAKEGVLIQAGLNHTASAEVVDFMIENRDKISNLSLRTALKLASLYKGDPVNWKKDAAVLELK